MLFVQFLVKATLLFTLTFSFFMKQSLSILVVIRILSAFPSPVISADNIFFTGIFFTEAAFSVIEKGRHIINASANGKVTLNNLKIAFFIAIPPWKILYKNTIAYLQVKVP